MCLVPRDASVAPTPQAVEASIESLHTRWIQGILVGFVLISGRGLT